MNIACWVIQVLLGVAFLAAGGTKLVTPVEELAAQGMTFAADIPVWVTKFAALAEVAGALGLILPAATRIKPKLTGWAGVGLATVMLLALLLHVSRGEYDSLLPNIVLGSLAAFVAWGRLSKAPIEPR